MRSSASPRRSRSRTGVSWPSATTRRSSSSRDRRRALIDAGGRTVLPGLYDSHVHSVDAAVSELRQPLPVLKSLKDVFAYIRKKAAKTARRASGSSSASPSRRASTRPASRPRPSWTRRRRSIPCSTTRGRPASSTAWRSRSPASPGTRPIPRAASIVKDADGEPTGMLRNAYGVLKGVPSEDGEPVTPSEKLAAVKKLFALYNAQRPDQHRRPQRQPRRTSTSIWTLHASRRTDRARQRGPRASTPTAPARRSSAASRNCPARTARAARPASATTGFASARSRCSSTAACSTAPPTCASPGRKGETYQITEDDYRGLLFIPPEQLQMVVEEAAKRNWQVTAHTAGEGAMDVLLDAYEFVNRIVPIKDLRFCITHANFPSQHNLERCQRPRRLRRRAAGLALQGRHHAAEGARQGADALVPAVQERGWSTRPSAAAATT